MKLALNPNLSIRPFDTTANEQMMLCEIPTRKADLAARYAIPAKLVAFLERFDGKTSLDEVIKSYAAEYPGHYTSEKLNTLVVHYCIPKQLLIDPMQTYEAPMPSRSRREYLYLKVGLIPASMVAKLTRPLKGLFRWPVILSFLPFFVITQVLFLGFILPHYHFNLNDITGFDFFLLTTITSVFGLFHELGHASALTHYGGKRAEIGWGLYFVFTVFYTDLSEGWRLKRTQRAMIDVGGIYFHCISLILLLALIYFTHWPILVYCFFFIDTQIAGSLNPFLRMDGYWLMADLFGISDLRKQSLGMLERGFYKLVGIKAQPMYPAIQLSRGASVFVCLYSVVGFVFFIYLTGIMFHQLAFRLLPAYPKLVFEFLHVLTTNPTNILELMNLLAGIVFKGVALFGLSVFGYRFVKGVSRFIVRLSGGLRVRFWRSAPDLTR
jgi:putative peptide zinc metalloprotease protein